MINEDDHRLTLERHLGGFNLASPSLAYFRINVIGLNPSRAGQYLGEDQTSTKIARFCKLANATHYIGTNTFTRIATDPYELRSSYTLNHPSANRILQDTMYHANAVVVMWGTGSGLRKEMRPLYCDRVKKVIQVARDLRITLRCCGVNKDGSPKHFLYAPYPTKKISIVDDIFPIWNPVIPA